MITDPDTGQQTLIWSNVADLAPGSTTSLSFSATLSAAAYPVGSDAINNADVYTNSDPRSVPKFTSSGEPVPLSFTESASDLASTRVSAATAPEERAEPRGRAAARRPRPHHRLHPDGDQQPRGRHQRGRRRRPDPGRAGVPRLRRGRQHHDRPGVPRRSVAGRDAGRDELSDARLGQHRHQPGRRPGRRLHPRGLDPRQPRPRPGRHDPVRRRHPAARQHHDLRPARRPRRPASARPPTSTTTTVRPPARRRPSRPTPTTRPSPATTPARSHPGTDHQVSAHATPRPSRSEDVRMRKASDTGHLRGGRRPALHADHRHQRVRRRLRHRGDRPPPQRPVSARRRRRTTSRAHPPTATPPLPSRPRTRRITGVVQNADGSFDVTFSPLTLDANGTTQIHYFARMRTTYTGGGNAGDPTSSGDTFTNTAHLTATTNPAPGVDPPAPTGPETVGDESSATLTAGGPQLQKSILPQTTPMTCGTTGDGYAHDPTAAQSTFNEGDRVCFKIRVQFPDRRRHPQPQRPRLPAARASPTSPGRPPRRPPTTPTSPSTSRRATRCSCSGDPRTKPTFRFVPRGAVFEVVLSAIVGAPAVGPAPDITANLAKFTFATSTGTVSQRDAGGRPHHRTSADLGRQGRRERQRRPGQPARHRQRRRCAAATSSPSGSTSTTTAPRPTTTRVDMLSPDVWDVLPLGITCADISAISDGGVCTNPDDPDPADVLREAAPTARSGGSCRRPRRSRREPRAP